MILAVIAVYLSLVLAIGLFANRLFSGTGEDYFLASRSIGSFVLVMTLFGTNMTAFTILGASGEAYAHGIGVFALMASSSSLVIPLLMMHIGIRLWRIGKRHGYVTQAQFFRARYESDAVGYSLFGLLVLLLVPYVLIGVKGSGDALMAVTGGPERGLAPWVGSFVVCVVIFVYVTYGGMRATSWANTFQTSVFMTVGALAFFVILSDYGGLEAAMMTLQQSQPELLAIGRNSYQFNRMVSYLLVPLSTAVFPHIFSHWLSAKRARSFRVAIVCYPIFIAVVWIPSVVLGVVGNIRFDSNTGGPILVRLITEHAGGLFAGLLAAGIFAAIMSSLDSQTLAVGTMFTHDIVARSRGRTRLNDRQVVWFGRVFVGSFLLMVFVLSMLTDRSIFSMGVWSLSGFAALFPLVLAALFWRASTRYGTLAALGTVALSWTVFFIRSTSITGEYTILGTGWMPVVGMFAASSVVLVGVSLVTRPPSAETLEKFF